MKNKPSSRLPKEQAIETTKKEEVSSKNRDDLGDKLVSAAESIVKNKATRILDQDQYKESIPVIDSSIQVTDYEVIEPESNLSQTGDIGRVNEFLQDIHIDMEKNGFGGQRWSTFPEDLN